MRILTTIMFILCLTGCRSVRDEIRSLPGVSAGPGITVVTNESNIVNNCNSPIVMIKSSQGALSSVGNACIVRHNGRLFVLTAWHVISDGGIITIWDGMDKRIDVTLGEAKILSSSDVAVIPIISTKGKLSSLEFSQSALQIGSSCNIEGYDHTGKKVKYDGVVKAVKLESSCHVERGLSGSPLIANGKVVGVTTSIVSHTDSVTGLTSNGGGHISAQNFINLLE